MQFAVGDTSKLRNGLGRAYDRGLPRFRAEAALRDVQSRPRQPIRVRRIRVWFKDGFGLGSEHDAEALDHGRQNSARCSVDQRWRSAYEPTRRSRIIEPKFDVRIVSGDGIHAGPGPSLRLRPS